MEMTPERVDAELQRLYDKLELESEEMRKLGQEFAILDAGYRLDYARSFRNAEGSMQLREQEAKERTHEKFLEMRKTEEAYRSKRELIVSVRQQLQSLGSMSANIRAARGEH